MNSDNSTTRTTFESVRVILGHASVRPERPVVGKSFLGTHAARAGRLAWGVMVAVFLGAGVLSAASGDSPVDARELSIDTREAGGGNGTDVLGIDLAAVEVEDTRGVVIRPFADAQASFHILIFLSIDCPICNKYAPEIARLAAHYTPRGITFWMVHPLVSESPDAIRRHAMEYALPGVVVRDPKRVLTRAVGAATTPEAALLDRRGRLLYRGRIDDRFPDLGRQRAVPVENNLKDAVEAVLAGRPVPQARTRAVGCAIPATE